jgi:hypothetical protein
MQRKTSQIFTGSSHNYALSDPISFSHPQTGATVPSDPMGPQYPAVFTI